MANYGRGVEQNQVFKIRMTI